MSINCFHCFLPLSARESSLTVSLEEQRLAFVVRYLKLLILFDSMMNDKKFYNLTNPHSINIHFMIKGLISKDNYLFSLLIHIFFVSFSYSLADFSCVVFLQVQSKTNLSYLKT